MADFSVTLNITNKSSFDLKYDAADSSTVDHAFFDPNPPVALIAKEGGTGQVYINDTFIGEGAEGTVTYYAETGSENKYYQFSGSCPVIGDNFEKGPGKTSGTGSSGHPVTGDFTIDDNTMPSWVVKDVKPVMQQIETIVFLMLENRSLDNVLGMLYSKANPPIVQPKGSSPEFNGVPLTAKNCYHGTCYSPSDGCDSMSAPSIDPGEDFEHVQNQFYADDKGTLPNGLDWGKTEPTMTGFAWDYDSIISKNQEIMGSYNKAQLPALYGLAENYAVSDRWFCSVPTQTYANRAFSICGTSLGKVDNSEIHGTSSIGHSATYADSRTIFNTLGSAGKSWGFYWIDTHESEMAAGSPVFPAFQPFTPYYFPQLKKAANGTIYPGSASHTKAASPFMKDLQAGTLPNFCYLEPAWGGGVAPVILQGTDMHPPTNVGPGDDALRDLFNALVGSPQWKNMLLVITVDEHGGTYDHVPPPLTVAPDNSPPSSATSHGFDFQRLGARVPTLLVSPFVPKGVVFRSPTPEVEYDHSSFIATLCKWAGVDPAAAGFGARVAQAPTFEGVLSSTARTDVPVLEAAAEPETEPAADVANTIDPLTLPAPKGADGTDLIARPIQFGDLHAAAEASESPEEFVQRLQTLRYRSQ